MKVLQEEFDLIDLLKLLWLRKWTTIKVAAIFTVIGLIIALTSPLEYEAGSILILETDSESTQISSSLGGLASIAGVDLGRLGESSGINPALYQSVSRSTPFLLELMEQEYRFKVPNKTLSIREYYEQYYKTGLFSKISSLPHRMISWLRGGKSSEEHNEFKNEYKFLHFSKYELQIMEDLKSRVNVEMDWDLNVLRISIEMQDAVVAAEMTRFTQDYITNYVTEYAIQKSQRKLKSINKQYEERRTEFEKAQSQLAFFRDKNMNVTTARIKSEEERLLTEYNLASNIFDQLAQQREAIKLQIQDNTPVFTVLEPVSIPVQKSKPRRSLILILYTTLGVLVGLIYSIIKKG